MKIQHWAIIFIIIILPFSIICRNTISKKNLLLRDETRINNIIDNATYDAVSQIIEISEELGYGKNIPITRGVADAAIDRFFNTLSVNFNLPIGREKAEAYFSQYIPAIIIVGYDGLYVYSYEETNKGYEFTLKPKIPYACEYKIPSTSKSITINFTLDNYVSIYFPDDVFLVGAPFSNDSVEVYTNGTHVLSGYIGNFLDVDSNGIDDLKDFLTPEGNLILCPIGSTQYTENDDPYGIQTYPYRSADQINYIKNTLPMFTDNLSYILREWAKTGSGASPNTATYLSLLTDEIANQDYVYDDDGNVITDASDFHLLRRETIVNLITAVLKEEFNQHNDYTDALGLTYQFNVPQIGRDQWNNTINDISVLAFFQGMPIGTESYYNNYSLGGTRIVQSSYLYAERVKDASGNVHRVYHKAYCRYIPRDEYGNIIYGDTNTNNFQEITFSDGTKRITTGIEQIFINSNHARKGNDGIKGTADDYYVCSHCM